MARHYDHFEIIASDLRIPESQTIGPVQGRVVDATNLPFPDKSFDLVVCAQALHHFTPSMLALVLKEAIMVGRDISMFDLQRTYYGVAIDRDSFRGEKGVHESHGLNSGWIRVLCERWLQESSGPENSRICKRALRSLSGFSRAGR